MSSGVVDERVVQMRFDNEQFEKGVSSSMASLKNLNKTIDDLPNTSKNGFSRLAESVKGFSMEAMGNAIESVQSRFSTLGIIGATIIQNLTNTVVNGAKKIVSSAWDGIITGGFNRASNIEQAKFMLKGLGVAWKDIEADINYGVQDTAYSLDSAAKAAAQLVASSVELGPSMQAALRGISGVAAMTNSDYDSIANIFTTIAGQGKVMTMQLRMLEMRGMNVAANIAKLFNEMNDGTRDTSNMSENFVKMVKNYTKGAEVTEAAIREMVSDGKMDFEMFSNAMNEAFGDHAKEANNTLTGVLANVKSALAKIGEAFISPIIENEGPLVKFLDQIRAKLNQAKDIIKPFGKAFGESVNTVLEKWGSIISNIDTETFTKIISNIANSIFNLVDAISHVGKFISAGFKSMLPNEDYENKFLSLSEALVKFTGNIDDLTTKVKNIQGFGALGKALYSLLHIVKQFKDAGFDAIKKVFEHFKTGEGIFYRFATNISDFIQGVDKSIEESGLFVNAFDKIADAIIFVGDKLKALIGWFKELFKNFTFIDNIKEKFSELKESVGDLKQKLKSDKSDFSFFDVLSTALKGIIKVVDWFANRAVDLLALAKKAFGNFFNTLKEIAKDSNGSFDKLLDEGLLVSFSALSVEFIRRMNIFIRNCKGLINPLQGALDSLLSGFSDVLLKYKTKLNFEMLKDLAASILEISIALLILSSIDPDRMTDALSGLTVAMGELIGAVAIIQKVNTDGFSSAKLIGFFIGFSTAIVIISKAMKNISLLNWDQIGKSLVGIGGAMAELSGALIAISRLSKSSVKIRDVLMILALAEAIKKISIPLQDIGKMEWEQIGKGLTGMGAALGALTGAVILIGRFSGSSTSKSVLQLGSFLKTARVSFGSMNKLTNFAGILMMAEAINVLVPALNNLSKLSWERLGKAGAGLVGITAIMGGFMMLTKTVKGTTLIAAGVSISFLADAIKRMTPSLYTLATIKTEKLLSAVAGISTVLFEFSLISQFSDYKKMLNVSSALLTLALAMVIMTPAFKGIATLNAGQLIGVVAAIGSLMLALGALANNIKSAKNVLSAASAMVIFGVALDLMAPALLMIGNLNIGQIIQGIIAFGGLMAGLGVLSNFSSSGDLIKTSAALTIFAGAMLILAPALRLLGTMDMWQVSAALIMIAGTITIFAVAAVALKPVIGTMASLAGTMALFGASCIVVGAGLLVVGAGLTAIAGGVAALGPALTVLSATLPTIIGIIPSVIAAAITGITIAISDNLSVAANTIIPRLGELFLKILEQIRKCVPELVDTLLKIITEVLKSLVTYLPEIVGTIVELIIQIIDKLADSMPKFISSMSKLVKGFIGAIAEAFKDLDTDQLVEALKSMGILSAVFLAITVTGALAGLAAINIAIITGVLALCTYMFGLITNMGTAEALPIMDLMSEILLKLSEAMSLLALFGIAAALNTVLGLIPVVAALTTVLEILGALKQIPGFEWLLTEGGAIFVQLGELIGEFIGSIISGGLKALSSALPEIGANLSAFFISAMPFIAGMKMVDAKVLAGVGIMAGAIVALTAAEVLDGVASFLTGGTTFAQLGQQLCDFAPYFVKFAGIISGVDGATVQASASAAKTLAEFAAALPNDGGIVSWFTGDNKLSDFAEALVDFGPKLKQYADSISGMSAKDVEASAAAAKTLAEFAEAIPNEGGVVSWFTGDNSLAMFAEELVKFGPSIKQYAESVSGIKTEDVEASVAAAQMICGMADNIPNQGGVASWFAGDNTLSMLAEGLAIFGPAIKKYGDDVAGIKPEAVETSVNAAKMISGLIEGLPNQGGVASWFAGDNTLAQLALDMVTFGKNFKEYYDTVSGISPETLNSITVSITNLVSTFKGLDNSETIAEFGEALSDLASDSLTDFVQEFKDCSDEVRSAIQTLITYVTSEIDVQNPILEEKATSMAGKVITAFEKKYREGYDTCVTLISKCLDGLQKNLSEFEKIGKNAVAGFIDGMKSKLDDVAKEARAIGLTAKDSTMEALDEHSPSKVYKTIGNNADLGFVEGMEVGLPEVKKAAEKVGLEAVTSLIDITDEGIEDLKKELQNGGEEISDTLKESGEDINKVSEDTLLKTFEEVGEGAEAMSKKLGTSSKAIEIFAKNYISNSKGITTSSQALTESAKGIAALSISLIENSNKTKKAGEQTALTLNNMKKAYVEYYDSLKSTIEGQIDVFSAFEKKTDMSMETMLSNIKSQLDGVKEWGAMLGSLAGKIDDGLMKTLADMGPKGYEYVAALASGTGEQLALYNQYWAESQNVAAGVADNLMASMAQNALWVTEGFVNGVNPKAANPVMDEFAHNLLTAFKTPLGIASPSKMMYDNGMFVCQGLQNGVIMYERLPIGAMQTLTDMIIVNVKSKLNQITFGEIGRNICEGLRQGIASGSSSVINEAVSMCKEAIEKSRATLDEHSPSKVFRKIGEFIPLGMAEGIEDYSKYARYATEDMANDTIKGFQSAKDQILSAVNLDLDLNPVIRPTLDLSSIRSGASALNSMFENTTVAANARGLQNGGDSNSINTNGASISFTQNNYSPNALSRTEIYRQTNNQLSHLRGMVNA